MTKGSANRLVAMPGATVSMRESELMVGGGDRLIEMPVPTYVIEHPKGLVLFDSGCNPSVATDPQGYWGHIADYLHVRFTPELVVDAQLRQHGYRPEDIRYVVVSHLHLDHAGGLALFPNARFFIMRGELNYAYWPEKRHRAAFKINDLMPTRRFDWIELEGDTDLFDDGSLLMMKTPGHTPGESSLLVRVRDHQPIVLTGDTLHLRGQFNHLAPSETDFDRVAASASVARLKDLRDRGEARVWVMHDPEDWATYPHVIE
ncbi:MAG: N-acyl homoserine lactonase family protein [Candidatus Binataceae bacterium]|nr:N-acyl homoserine lactonase family protein [Candidatus Binataceae bacterium]